MRRLLRHRLRNRSDNVALWQAAAGYGLRPCPSSKIATMVALLSTSESFVRNPLHARGPVRPFAPTAFNRSKPKPQADLNQSTEPRDAQLVSCSRDPIEYDASEWNLHAYVSGNSLTKQDPMGLMWALNPDWDTPGQAFSRLWKICFGSKKPKAGKLPGPIFTPSNKQGCLDLCSAAAKTPAEGALCQNFCAAVETYGNSIYCKTLGSFCGKFKDKRNLELCYSICLNNCSPGDCVRP